jgi:hypothetical protein
MANPAAWLEVREAPLSQPGDASLKGIDAGEKAAIQLALSLHADLLLMDDRKGVKTARSKGFRVTGTLGILELAAQAGLVDFPQAAERLRRTTFRSPEALLDAMLKKTFAGRRRRLTRSRVHPRRIQCFRLGSQGSETSSNSSPARGEKPLTSGKS